MTLEGLLAFIGILIAIFTIAGPVQRHSLKLFVPLWYLGAALVLSVILIVCRDAPFGWNPPFGWPLPVVRFGLSLGAFLIPVVAIVWCWTSWHQARLTERKMKGVENIFKAGLRESQFDEVERILRKNQERLEHLPPQAAAVLFNPRMVAALVESHSLVHLELLANMRFLRALDNRHGAVDAVVRELLLADVSPLHAAVISRYGGLEHLTYSGSERALMEKTFQNPEWYFEASAHYPLLMSAVEELRSGKRDTIYNDVGQHYGTSQGTSPRSRCPIYLAIKTEVLAIESALEKRFEEDLYVTDLFDIFRAVLERSKREFGSRFTRLGEVAAIKRGITSGCDAFFMPRNVSAEFLGEYQTEFEWRKSPLMRRCPRSDVESGKIVIVKSGDGTMHPIEVEYVRPEVHSLMQVDRPVVTREQLDRVVLWVDQELNDLKDTYGVFLLKR